MVSCHSLSASARAVVTVMASRAGDGRHRAPAGTGAPASLAGERCAPGTAGTLPIIDLAPGPSGVLPREHARLPRSAAPRPRAAERPGRGAGAGLVRARWRGVQKAQRPVAARGAAG